MLQMTALFLPAHPASTLLVSQAAPISHQSPFANASSGLFLALPITCLWITNRIVVIRFADSDVCESSSPHLLCNSYPDAFSAQRFWMHSSPPPNSPHNNSHISVSPRSSALRLLTPSMPMTPASIPLALGFRAAYQGPRHLPPDLSSLSDTRYRRSQGSPEVARHKNLPIRFTYAG